MLSGCSLAKKVLVCPWQTSTAISEPDALLRTRGLVTEPCVHYQNQRFPYILLAQVQNQRPQSGYLSHRGMDSMPVLDQEMLLKIDL
jgi:hypothetical protein